MSDTKNDKDKEPQKGPQKEHRMMDDEGSWNYTPPEKKKAQEKPDE